jgi:excisionase family DNA binding protein
MMDDLLTVEEAAAYLRVSRATVWRWCKSRKVPAVKIGREWRIMKQTLIDLLARGLPELTETSDVGAARR